MTDRPILFSAPMVRAILDGRKTQTRRVLNPQPNVLTWQGAQPMSPVDARSRFRIVGEDYPDTDEDDIYVRFAPGDRLWVRESFAIDGCGRRVRTNKYEGDAFKLQRFEERLQYLATDTAPSTNKDGSPYWWNSRPSIHMPRWASRLTLSVSDVRMQRLQDINTEDAIAEGIEPLQGGARAEFQILWDSINAKRNDGIYAWKADPWVVAVIFDVHKVNIDQMGGAS